MIRTLVTATIIGFLISPFSMRSFSGVSIDGNAVYAQTSTTLAPAVAPAPQVSEAPVSGSLPTWFDKILAALKNSGGIIAGFLVAFEIALRLIPTIKPLSILLPVKYVVDSLATILAWLSNLLVSLINIANKSEQKIPPKV